MRDHGATVQAATAIGGVTGRIQEINLVASPMAAAVEQQAAATQVLNSSTELSRQSERLWVEVAKFLATVRAA